MASITSMGIGSGLDIASLVSQLVKAEGEPAIARLNRQELKATAQLSALGSLKSALSSLRNSLKGLADQSAFRALTATSSHESLVGATASDLAQPGQYQVEVMRLAQRHKLASDTFDGTQTFGGSAGDQIRIGAGGVTFTLDLTTTKTLAEIRDAINTANGNPGVAATILQVDSSRQVLILTAAESGQAQAITLTETLAAGPSLSIDTANLDATGQPLTDPALLDAALGVDGISITRPGNQIADLIEGLTLDLRGAEPGSLASLDLRTNQEAITEAVSGFVTQYNAFLDTLNAVAGFRGVGAEQPPLFGDAAARGISSRLRNELARELSDPEGAFSTLSEVGVSLGRDGKLTLDAEALGAALAEDLNGVAVLFGAEGGLAKRLDGLIGSYLESGGIIDARSKGLEGRLDRIDDSRESLERRLSALEARYRQQFTVMDALIGQLQATSSFLTQQLATLTPKES